MGMAFGIPSVVLTFVGIGMTLSLTIASVLFSGFLILFDGIAQLVQSFQCNGWKDRKPAKAVGIFQVRLQVAF